MTRRQWIEQSLLGFCAVTAAMTSVAVSASSEQRPVRVVVFGGHPDDPESASGGLITMLTRAGHEVICAYGTCFRGDRQINGEPEGIVRRREATAACEALHAKPKFFDYDHEKLTADAATLAAVRAWLEEVKPDIVVTHWPLDMHPNHHAVSSLVWQCYQRSGGWNLYFFEVETNRQSISFRPEIYLDIESVRDLKKQALDCHVSQHPDEIWKIHDQMHRDRGGECGVRYAEAYSLVEAKAGVPLLPVSFVSPRKVEVPAR